ncbi:MAG: hypothetical protein AB1593_06895 [Pseudomonadota bacterium]
MRAVLLLLGALALPAWAGWQWDAPLDVSTVQATNIFPHLESANRQGIAASSGAVAVVWEDNRSGVPRCQVAIRPAGAVVFQPERTFDAGECYEPVVAALGQGRFLAAWEEAGRVWARVLPEGEPVRLSALDAVQITLATRGNTAYAAWAEQAGRFKRIVVAVLAVEGDRVSVREMRPVEAAAPADEQAWPALAVTGDDAVVVIWEDRRHRHTVPYASRARAGLDFSSPVRVSDQKSGRVDGLGAGLGAMRPTLAAWGARGAVAVWLDKRDFLSGYDVYAAFDAGEGRFGRNQRVHDSFGDNMAQWHARVVSGGGRLLAVWDDARDGTPDVWLANWGGASFGDNLAVPAASGPDAQSDPVATLDEAGALHVAWLAHDRDGARVRYARAVWR